MQFGPTFWPHKNRWHWFALSQQNMLLLVLGFLTFTLDIASCQVYYDVTAWNSTTAKGETVPLKCTYENITSPVPPVISVIWQRNGTTVFTYNALRDEAKAEGPLTNRTTKYSHTASSSALFISDGDFIDIGKFECKVEPGAGAVLSAAGYVNVQDKVSQTYWEYTTLIYLNGVKKYRLSAINSLDVDVNVDVIITAEAICARPGIKLWFEDDIPLDPSCDCDKDCIQQKGYARHNKTSVQSMYDLRLHGFHASLQFQKTIKIKVCRLQIARVKKIVVCVVCAIVFLGGGGVFVFFYCTYIKSMKEEEKEKKKCAFIGMGAGLTVAIIALITVIVIGTLEEIKCS